MSKPMGQSKVTNYKTFRLEFPRFGAFFFYVELLIVEFFICFIGSVKSFKLTREGSQAKMNTSARISTLQIVEKCVSFCYLFSLNLKYTM